MQLISSVDVSPFVNKIFHYAYMAFSSCHVKGSYLIGSIEKYSSYKEI